MLILAGVSLNATLGENGIITRAQEASKMQKIADEMENLNLELTKINIDTISNDEADTIQSIVDYLKSKGVIDDVIKTSSGQIAVGIDKTTGNQYFFGIKGENTYKISRKKDNILMAELVQNTSGGDIAGGSALVTADSFNNDSSLPKEEKGKFTITSDANVAFMDSISGELSIYVKSGVHATVEVYADMILTNKGMKRSAIDIEPGGILDLYIAEGANVIVDSGQGESGEAGGTTFGAKGGPGGYAGIHCWNNGSNSSVLNLSGKGTIKCFGGNAGFGNGGTYGEISGGRWWRSWRWNRWKWWRWWTC